MNDFFKNKEILIYHFLLILLCILFFILAYGHFGLFFTDTSREVYIPFAINNGNILYKDIFNIYAPFSYQINAFLCSIFGENLKTFYFIGLINAIIFILGLFNLACLFLKKVKFLCFLFSCFIVSSCIFAVSQSNYIFPYSYAAVYSLSAIIYSLYFLLLYIKNNNNNFFIISSFLFGFSLVLKYDFILFGIALILVFLFLGERKKYILLYSLSAFLIMPLLSLFILLFQGVSISDLKEAHGYMNLLLHSNTASYCYKFMGIIPNIETFKFIAVNFFKTLPVILFILFFSYKITSKKINKIFKYSILSAFSITVIFILKKIFFISNASYFNWIGIILLFQFIVMLIYMKRNHLDLSQNLFGQTEISDKMFFVLCFSVILISIKCITSLNLNYYGAYYLPLTFLCVFLYSFNFLIKRFNKNAINTAFSIIFIILFFSYAFSNNERRYTVFNSEIKTEKSIIYIENSMHKAISDMINYINQNTDLNDKILVLPEGAMINFLTKRISDNKYYYLIPSNIDIFGEDNIVNDLKNNLPDYIIFQPLFFNNFGETYFCGSFGLKICSLLPEYYERPVVFGSDFHLAIYKRK